MNSVRYYGTYEAQAHGHDEGVIVKMTCYFAEFEGEPKAASEIEEIVWLTFGDIDKISPVDRLIFFDLNKEKILY